MKKHIVITLVLLMATAFVTVVYFKNLSTPGMRTSQLLRTIPDNAAFILEFNNDTGFYDIFKGNKLFSTLAGKEQMNELDTMRQIFALDRVLKKYLTGQNVFVSLHPLAAHEMGLLLTASTAKGFEPVLFDEAAKQPNSGLIITPFRDGNNEGYNIYISALKKRFYVIVKDNNILSASFSKQLADQSSAYKPAADKTTFVLLSEQQNASSLANLYVNYGQLSPLFNQLFLNKNSDIFKSFRMLPALAALSLNYRSDALMFNGSTAIQRNQAASYLDLFSSQQPVANHLKDIFPSTLAYATNFAMADPKKFASGLNQWHIKAGLESEKDQLFSKVKAESGTSIKTEFNRLLGNEFAIVTTRYFEKLAIISVTDGSKLRLVLSSISQMSGDGSAAPSGRNIGGAAGRKMSAYDPGYFFENTGHFTYEKLPFFLLGDAFSVFKRPYFMIIDNYLILANSSSELTSYYDIYLNRKFLSKNDQYNRFDNLLAERSNVSFFFHFKNALPILKRDLYPDVYSNLFEGDKTGWANFYAASWQFTAADNNFYTNFSLRLTTDSATVKN